jgi:RNA 2',3'-cyclic 3'-phosphodiesterase
MRVAKHVLYFALQPPPEAAAQALALAEDARRAHRLAGKPVAAGRLHVSLNNVGEFKRPPTPVIAKALEAVQAVAVRPFVVEFNRLGTWKAGEQRPVVLWGDEGVVGVNDLYSVLHKALHRVDLAPRREAEMAPHMTVVWDEIEIPETFVEPVRWRVDEFVLIHAVHGEGRHDVVGRVPLSA